MGKVSVIPDFSSVAFDSIVLYARNLGKDKGQWKDTDDQFIRNLYTVKREVDARVDALMESCREKQRKGRT